jgi:hypothetical protein
MYWCLDFAPTKEQIKLALSVFYLYQSPSIFINLYFSLHFTSYQNQLLFLSFY